MRPGRVVAGALAAVAVLGLAALVGFGTVRAPAPDMLGLLPGLTLGTILVAGVADGFNPCAFTVLLLFITALATATQARAADGVASIRARVVGLGTIYIAAVFVTYLALGVGVLATASVFTERHLPARLGALASIALGLWMLKDYFAPELGWHLAAPQAVGRWARAAAQRATVPALVGGGVLIGLCTVPCSGAIYLAILALLAAQPSAIVGFGYLTLYNVMFVLPLVVVLLAASARPALNRLAHWNLHHGARVRLVLGGGTVLLGFVILVTV
ncbi:MAG TPA: hypothetical protein DDZ42_19710 [Candidatus Rokubacteria bacterium]|nr:MAG: hypothetical protein A2050_05070 [Candidatus Rokubacteria bacterium GWA2_73_35]HAM54860.1 hypothetical protein [Candidatus Rokubacteria bacterium]HBH04103.1 hypothetical protein [Candidatus Rokubacteria bacterium]